MSDERETRAPGTQDAQPLRIPDGGLGAAMPAWVRQTPAWKQEPVRMPDLPKTLPPPDDSPIDPSRLIDVDDLPGWLQSLARASEPVVATGVQTGESVVSAAPDDIPAAEPDVPPQDARVVQAADGEAAVAIAPAAGEPVRAAPVTTLPVPAPAPERNQKPPSQPLPPSEQVAPWWLSDRVLGLILLGIVLAMIYIVLAVSGVV